MRALITGVAGFIGSTLAEQLCHLYFVNVGVPTVSLRSLRATILGEPIAVFGDGEETRDFTFVSDAVNANVFAATRGVTGRVYNIWRRIASLGEPGARADRTRRRPPPGHYRQSRARGGHAASVRRYDPRALGSRLYPHRRTRRGSRGRASVAGWNTVSVERPRSPWWKSAVAPGAAMRQAPKRAARHRSWLGLGGALAVAALVTAAACATRTRSSVPAGTTEPDKFLFDKGTDALNARKWLTAREFFKQVTETYTASPYRPDAKLGIGDTYIGEGTSEALVLAINEFTEFLSFYPTNRRADYAQLKLGMAHFRQMRLPQRDQTETRAALKEFETFVARFPNSSLMPEAKTKLRETRDRLSQADYQVGYFYFRQKWYRGAIDRFKSLLKEDPGFTGRDAVYYYLAESLVRNKQEAEALPYFEQLVKEFEQSEYLVEAQKRITGLKTQVTSKTSGG